MLSQFREHRAIAACWPARLHRQRQARGGPGPYGGFGFNGIAGATTVQLDGCYLGDTIDFGAQIQSGSAPGGVPEAAS